MENAWDQRYAELGSSLRASMFKSLPEALNLYLHQWQLAQAVRAVSLVEGRSFLDAGCGPGRLSSPLAEASKDCFIVGLDRSLTAIQFFNHHMTGRGSGCVSDITKLPFTDASFDLVIMVSTLMYLQEPSQQTAAVRELMRVMRPGGRGMLIENNRMGWGLMAPLRLAARFMTILKKSFSWTISATTFGPGQIDGLLLQAGAEVLCKTGCPAFTLSLPILFAAASLSEPLSHLALSACRALDKLLHGWITASLYVCYEFRSGG